MEKNYFEYINLQNINKKANILINIPTFNSYEITKNTISQLLKQEEIKFDILLVDNASNDYKKLCIDFPNINYVVLKENTGSSGAQRIGGEIALKYKYDYVIFTDNDALLLQNDGLKLLKKRLDSDSELYAVVPKNIESDEDQNDLYINAYSFHYLFVKTKIFNKISFHNFYIFLYGDDSSLTLKIKSISKILLCGSVKYYHYLWDPKSLNNFYNYFYLRGLLIIIFMEKNILIKDRISCVFNFFYKIFQMLFAFFKFWDFSYIKTIFYSFIGFFNISKDFKNKIPLNKCSYKEIEYTDKNFVEILKNKMQLFLLPKYISTYSRFNNKTTFYKLDKNQKN